LDNGAYRNWLAGESFDGDTYLRAVDRAVSVETPDTPIYFAVIPDIVAGGLESLTFSLAWLDRMPQTWPLYLAVQDGICTNDITPDITSKISGIFLGGSNRYKATAAIWANFAHTHNLQFHYGRAGTPWKLLHAMESGADSLDSAFPLWTQKRWNWFLYLYDNGHPQYNLFQEAT
jgi:hypothetical protein